MFEETSVVDRYDYMSTLSSSRWAWEAVRRNPELRDDAANAPPIHYDHTELFGKIRMMRILEPHREAAKWGLSFFPNPNQSAYEASAFWSDDLYPRALAVQCVPRGIGEVDLNFVQAVEVCDRIDHVITHSGREQILLRANGHVAQIRCEGLSMQDDGLVKMELAIGQLGEADAKMDALGSLRTLVGETPEPKTQNWTRQTLVLRDAMIALDCNDAGLTAFDTACVIYGRDRAEDAWAGPSEAMHQKMKRALKLGRHLRDGGYRKFLTGAI
ncbi:MAG: DUF2285 domain-containing protein [Pseudomonadota bacterium]